MTVNEHIAQARTLFSDKLSLRIFNKRVEIGTEIKQKVNPEKQELVEYKYNSRAKLSAYIQELQNPEKEKFIYGAGIGCKNILYAESMHALKLQGVVGIIDNHVTGERYGFPILSFQHFLEEHRSALVLNSVGLPAGREIHQQCLDAGVAVVSLFEIDRSWDQYFDLPAELGLVGKDEVFVHAGCYNGDTQKSFINWFGTEYEKMITFEPSVEQYKFCAELFQKFKNVELVQAGLSDKNGTASFDLDLPGRSFISETGAETIKTVSLDSYMGDRRVTFIALDIEGEEFNALKGAEQIIRTQKPKLAISVYHKPEDIYELPELIKSFRADYKLYLRHYHLLDMAETVLYAF